MPSRTTNPLRPIEHQNVITAREARHSGIDNKTLQRLVSYGELERVEKGLYISPDDLNDDFYLMQYRCPKGVFSHETALFFHDLTDRYPIQLTMTIPSGFNTRLLKDKEKYKFFYISANLHGIGKFPMKTPYGNEVTVYDMERTLCDCLKKRSQIESDLINDAFKLYTKLDTADYSKLLKVAETFRVQKEVKLYLEVLG